MATIFCLVLIFSLLVACGDTATDNNSSSPPAAADTPKETAGETENNETGAKVPATVAELALYEGADREQLLIEGAKKEGTVTVYGSSTVEDMAAVIEAFEKKYGIKVNFWRGSGEDVVQRILTETQAGRFEFDIMDSDSVELEKVRRESILQQVNTPFSKDLIEAAVQPHGEWIGTRMNIFTQAYNTNLVAKDELPQTWGDLLDPRWKGRLGIEEGDFDWLSAIANDLGEEKTIQLFKDIVAQNGISVRKGHTLLSQLVAAGEIPLSLTVYNYKPEQMKNEGAPIDWFAIGNAYARANGIALSNKAPHPHAALLFYDFILSEGQEIYFQRDIVPTSRKIETNLNKIPLKFVDAAVVVDEHDKWRKIYEEIFLTLPN
jgi:iron(III) transport system substrate-binding protein